MGLGEIIPQGVEVSAAGRWFVVGSLFVFGAILGSFMNVVVYRLPRRMSLSRPGSRCPECEHPIRWYDNVPIFGWIVLGGRCRDCGATISIRYPLIEVLVAAMSAALALVDVARPLILVPGAGTAYVLDFGPYALHMLLLCTLLCAALIELDGFRPPQWLLATVLVAGLVVTIAWPQLQAAAAAGQWILRGVPESIPGLFAALWLSLLAWPAWVRRGDMRSIVAGGAAAAELAMVGVYLGVWAAVAIGVASMAAMVMLGIVARFWTPAGRIGWAGCVFSLTLIWLLAHRASAPYWVRWTLQHDYGVLIASGAVVAALAVIVRYAGRKHEPRQKAVGTL